MNARFILAKYIPDMARMEPRNIGVFVWCKGEICAKFLEPSRAVSFVNDLDTYERWMEFWNKRIAADSISPSRGKPIAKSDPACLDALMTTDKGNYMLVDPDGEFLAPIRKKELTSATNQLFDELVADRPKREKHPKSFSRTCERVLLKSGVEYKTRQPIECVWKGVVRHLHPDYYIGNGHPDAFVQRAKLSNEHSVNSAALTIDALLEQQIVPADKCRVFVRSSDVNSEAGEEGMRLFEKLCGVIDVDTADACDHVSRLASV